MPSLLKDQNCLLYKKQSNKLLAQLLEAIRITCLGRVKSLAGLVKTPHLKKNCITTTSGRVSVRSVRRDFRLGEPRRGIDRTGYGVNPQPAMSFTERKCVKTNTHYPNSALWGHTKYLFFPFHVKEPSKYSKTTNPPVFSSPSLAARVLQPSSSTVVSKLLTILPSLCRPHSLLSEL